MASQTHQNRHCAKPIPSSSEPSLAGLPNELLLNILQHADIPSVLRLREASKRFVPVCNDAVKSKAKELKVIYVHPSLSSVKRAITICQLDLSSEVEELCFVSKNFHFHNDQDGNFVPAGPSAFPWLVRKPLSNNVSQPYPWTRAWARARNQIHEDVVSNFKSSYRELLSSLAALKITRFSFSEVCDKPGFNMISDQRIASWRETVEERKAEDEIIPPTTFKFADSDALASVLHDPRFTFTNLRIPHQLAYVGCAPSLGMAHIGSYRTLTHLDLTVNHGDARQNDWTWYYGDFLRSAASTLVELKIGFQYRYLTPKHYTRTSLEVDLACIFDRVHLPQLRRLEIHRFPAPDSGLPADNANTVMLQNFGLGMFVAGRCRKLQFLKLVNVFTAHSGGKSPRQPWRMANVVLVGLETAAREIEGLDQNTRAWEIDFSA
jgi:hypothetical protein